MFTHLMKSNLDMGKCSPAIFIWGPVAWALAGYFLTGWRWTFKTAGQGRDCLVLAAVLSVVMAIACSLLPDTPPAQSGGTPILQTFQMLGQPNFLVFIIISIGAAGVMQFYFQGTAQFMQDMGISSKNVPAVMAIAQVTQAVVTYFLLSRLVGTIGYKWTLTIGAACWLLLYAVYVAMRPRWLVIIIQSAHGFAYVFVIIAGQMFANTLAAEDNRSSMQALIFAATSGVGLFLGTQLAGVVMDKYRKDNKFQWRQVFTVPCAIIAACVIALLVLFRG
jgi:predicted MFS family arabinose efflux permease